MLLRVFQIVIVTVSVTILWYAATLVVEELWRNWRRRRNTARINRAIKIIFSKSLTEEITEDSELSKWAGQVENVIPGPSIDGGRLFTLASENESDVHA